MLWALNPQLQACKADIIPLSLPCPTVRTFVIGMHEYYPMSITVLLQNNLYWLCNILSLRFHQLIGLVLLLHFQCCSRTQDPLSVQNYKLDAPVLGPKMIVPIGPGGTPVMFGGHVLAGNEFESLNTQGLHSIT